MSACCGLCMIFNNFSKYLWHLLQPCCTDSDLGLMISRSVKYFFDENLSLSVRPRSSSIVEGGWPGCLPACQHPGNRLKISRFSCCCCCCCFWPSVDHKLVHRSLSLSLSLPFGAGCSCCLLSAADKHLT